jgi:hypothetical protein
MALFLLSVFMRGSHTQEEDFIFEKKKLEQQEKSILQKTGTFYFAPTTRSIIVDKINIKL